MYSLRRWWDRHRLQTVWVAGAIGAALLIRQTGAAPVLEVYQFLSRPFQSKAAPGLQSNAQTLELQQRLSELEGQNQRLKELLGYVATNKTAGVPAPVIGRGADHWWHQALLGRGSTEGVKVGHIVMAPGGLVGRITDTTPNTSRVLLLSDPSSRVGVTLSRSRNMGYLRGQAANRAVMEFFDKVPDVRKGDVVSTSTFSQLFPAGLPVGRVESVNLSKSPAPEAVIELTAPISFLEWGIIYPHTQATPPNTSPDSKTAPPL
ncbi:MAG TPA: rod shape-determining protein MreC [Thermosynechococcaceae cyanobacterium]